MTHPNDERTIVMGSAVGLATEQILPFLISVRNCGYRGDVALFVNRRVARGLRRQALSARVRLVPVATVVPFNFARIRQNKLAWSTWIAVHTVGWAVLRALGRLPSVFAARGRLQRLLARLICTPMEARFLHFREFLESEPYDRVLLTDVRDVLFQSDPFSQLPTAGLAVSIETRSYTIATERHNRDWMRDAYGMPVLDRIGGNPPSCVGVTYGGGEAISSYLDRMVDEILHLRGRVARQGGADTAIHNFLLWTNQLGTALLLETLGSAVATLNEVPEEDLELDPEGRLLNRDGSRPSVLHQYDRQPKVAPHLLQSLAS